MVGLKEKPKTLNQEQLLKNELVRDMILDLYFSKSGTYYQELYEEGLFVDRLRLEYYLEESFGFTAIGATTLHPEKFAERVKSMLLNIKEENINEDDFQRAKKKKYGELIREYNELEGIANSYIHYHQLDVDYRDVFSELENLTLDHLNEVIDEWIDESRMSVCMILPEDD